MVLNAGVALALAGGLAGDVARPAVVDALAAGVARAQQALDSGAAAGLLERWVAATRDLAG